MILVVDTYESHMFDAYDDIYKFYDEKVAKSCTYGLKLHTDFSLENLLWFIAHQANLHPCSRCALKRRALWLKPEGTEGPLFSIFSGNFH